MGGYPATSFRNTKEAEMKPEEVAIKPMPLRLHGRRFSNVLQPTLALCVAMLAVTVPRTSIASVDWHDEWNVRMRGHAVSVREFTSRRSVEEAVREIASSGRYERYLVADGRVLLSGVSSGRHWLAQVQGHPKGASGYVSALYFDPAQAPAVARAATSAGHAVIDASERNSERPTESFQIAAHTAGPQRYEFEEGAVVAMAPADGNATSVIVSGMEP